MTATATIANNQCGVEDEPEVVSGSLLAVVHVDVVAVLAVVVVVVVVAMVGTLPGQYVLKMINVTIKETYA
jgi:hypothetical protein